MILRTFPAFGGSWCVSHGTLACFPESLLAFEADSYSTRLKAKNGISAIWDGGLAVQGHF